MEPAREMAVDAKVIQPNAAIAHQHPWASRWGLVAALIIMAAIGFLLLCVVLVAAGATFLFLSDQNLVAQLDGELQPTVRHDLFAPDDCLIEEVIVEPGDNVERGQLLARLRSGALDAEHEALLSEQQSVWHQLVAGEETMIRSNIDEGERLKLAGQLRQWKIKIESLQRKQRLKAEAINGLQLRSPIEGQVVTGEFELLPGRPADRGQLLMKVVSVSGPWRLELPVQEAELSAILQAQASSAKPLEVQYRLATELDIWHVGVLEEIGPRHGSQSNRPTIRVRVDQADIDPSLLRPGTTVQARIRRGS